ncbi:alpha-L-rhamnosidase C-terminal domain-containing protein [Pedobacter panaciterrae]|uniref:alpha-L-rhamnosidase C-terminal domain-containing protein n=1 Tax=Pedobacter panaciterrae TaxID=363849 RepID=UPI002598905C|nr:alpha-L-rhamnosidase C-terminal domain-containing protein [uncultured Pedobacter sp.]
MIHLARVFFVITFFVFYSSCIQSVHAQSSIYPLISAKKKLTENPFSPDPLINYSWDDPRASDGLESYSLQPVSWTTSTPDSFNTNEFKKTGVIAVNGKGSICFDFGQTNAGWLEFESDDLIDSVTIGISEYNEPAIVNSGALHPLKTMAPVKHGQTYRLELNPEFYEGVRFGWINVLSHQQNWHIKSLRLVCQVKPVNYQGSFSCSDSELTRIWYTGAYTVKLNLQKDYFGAILMERSDRHSWTGDAYPSQAASMVAFGNYDFVKANTINTADLNNGILSYSLYWVLSLIDYVNYTGDVEFAKRYIDNACKKLDLAYQHFGKSPKLGFYGWDERLGAGFENPDIHESQRAYSMLTIRSWAEFGRLMKQIGRADLAQKYTNYAQQKIAEERKKKNWPNEFGLHASADAINTGLTTPKEDALFYQRNYTDRVNRLSYSPFNEYFIIGAMAKMQKHKEAISAVKDCWAGQIKYGGTTFFEVYRPSWNAILDKNDAPPNNQCGYTSLTHPWSAGVVKWLSEEILGIKPLEPGFKVFEIMPHLGDTISYVNGSTPTLNELISASFNVKSGITILEIPKGTLAKRVAIPLGGNTVKSLSLNGKPILNGEGFQIKEGYINVNNLTPGKYEYKITYKTLNKAAQVKDIPWNYPINIFRQDSLTSGNWKGSYGKEGFVLFNYLQNNKHLQKLPVYVSSVKLRNEANVHSELPADNRVLRNTTGTNRTFGAVVTKDPAPTLQTITMDVQVAGTQSHQIALYFLDWDNKERRSAVEVFDANTLKLISPVQLIKDYQNGKYLIFNYTGSIRIRINHVRGENAAVSGIFFDRHQ